MIVKDEFIKKLRAAFDLNIYEVKIWTALLSKGVAAAGELSDMSNVPRSRSYYVKNRKANKIHGYKARKHSQKSQRQNKREGRRKDKEFGKCQNHRNL